MEEPKIPDTESFENRKGTDQENEEKPGQEISPDTIQDKSLEKPPENKPAADRQAGLIPGFLIGFAFAAFIACAAAFMLKKTSKEAQIEDLIQKEALTDATTEDMTEGKYKGILESLKDKYASYYTAEETSENEKTLNGKYEGIGIGFLRDETTNRMTVAECYDSSPAKEAGVEVGDVLISADGKDVTTLTDDELSKYLQSKDGQEIALIFSRNGTEYTVSVTPAPVTLPVVSYEMKADRTGYIRIESFLESTSDQFKSALSDLKTQDMQYLIIDLRNNLGGLVSSASDCLNQILPEGLEVYMVEKDGTRTDYNSDGENALTIPLVILVNGRTASAAEIFTGACRDRLSSKLVGEKTYGKGIVQTTITLNDGSSIKYTSAHYYTPNGTDINKSGFTPDITVSAADGNYEAASDDDLQYQKALEVIKAG